MSRRFTRLLLLCSLAVIGSFPLAHASTTILFLLNGTTLRGEITDRSARVIQLRTPSGLVRVKTSTLMPISRQQLKLPPEIDKENADTPEMETVLAQMEKLLAENESLKVQLARMKDQLAKAGLTVNVEPGSPAEGPTDKP